MGIALLGLADLFLPLHALARRWAPQRRSAALRYVAVRPSSCAARPATTATAARPLRVVRMVDAQQPRAGTSRLLISGRMDEVCAELDRLAALEAAQQRH